MIIKRFILGEWFRAFIGAFAALFLLLTIAELINGFLRDSVTATAVMLNYALNIPAHISKILPITCMLASLFSINKLKGHSELIAIFAAGFRVSRFLILIIQASFLVALFQFVNMSFLEPYAQSLRPKLMPETMKRFKKSKGKGIKTSTLGTGKIWYKSQNYYVAFQAYDKKKDEIRQIDLFYFNKDYKQKTHLKAEKATYTQANIWRFTNGREYSNLAQEDFQKFTSFKERDLYLAETPEDFLQIESDVTTLNIFGLWNFIIRVKDSGISISEFLTLLLKKISSPYTCIVFALISTVTLFNPNRRSSSFGKNVVYTLVFSIFYWFAESSALALGNTERIHPFFATFGIPVIFTLFLAFIFRGKRRLT